MNVKNLKQMFEKQGTIQPKIPNNQGPKSIPKPLVTNELPINKILEEKIIVPEPKTTTKTTINKSFLQQLNKKLDNKNTNIGSVRAGGSSYLQPSQIISQQPKKTQNELKIEDIITGVANKKQASQSSKARYAINESNPRRSEQKSIFEQLGSIETSNDTVSFEELLTKAIKNMNLVPDQAQETNKNSQPRKAKVVNRYEYAQERLTKDQKLKRIDFVLKVVFGQNQYQIVPSNKQQIKKDIPVRYSQSKIQPFVPSQQTKKNNSQILFQNSTPVIVSTASTIIPQRVKSVNNAFLDELKKIQKKQTKIITNPQQIICNNTVQNKEKQPNIESLTPRQKKKQKKQQNFDDL